MVKGQDGKIIIPAIGAYLIRKIFIYISFSTFNRLLLDISSFSFDLILVGFIVFVGLFVLAIPADRLQYISVLISPVKFRQVFELPAAGTAFLRHSYTYSYT